MLRNKFLLTTLLVSAVTLSGCSSVWTKVGDLSYGMADFTKFSFLRGSSTKSDISFAETTVSEDGTYKTAVGEYIPTEVAYDVKGNAVVDTSQHPCPDGTYLNDDNACMFLETETFDFDDTLSVNAQQPLDTGPVPCPEDTYLTADNTCTYLETETFDFGDDLASNDMQPLDTGPVPCPDDTYLTADNTCSYLETETFDLAAETLPIAPTVSDLNASEAPALNAPASQEFALIPPADCPEGFTLTPDNSCMYLGAELKTQ